MLLHSNPLQNVIMRENILGLKICPLKMGFDWKLRNVKGDIRLWNTKLDENAHLCDIQMTPEKL